MRISNLNLNGFVVFIFLLFLAFYFRESWGKIQIYSTFVYLTLATVLYLTGSGIINQAKVKTPKIIGDGIKSTVLSSKRKELSHNFFAFGLGAFEDDTLMLKSIGKDGIVIVNKNSFVEVYENIRLIGNVDIILTEDVAYDWQIKIKEHFGYIPNTIYRVTPINQNKEIDLSNVSEKYVTDLNTRNLSLSVEVNQLSSLITGMTSNTSKLIQFTSNLARISLKPFKREIKDFNKKE